MTLRRSVAWLSTCTVVAAVFCTVLLANLTAVSTRVRLDLTSTGQHRLSPRTEQLLAHLGDDYEIVLAVDRSSIDRSSFDSVVDLMADLSRRSDRVRFRLIDVGTSAGRGQFDALVATLRERDRPQVESQASVMTGMLDRLATASAQLREVAGRLDALAASVTDERADSASIRRFLQQAAALARVQADQTASLADDARAPLQPEAEELPDTPRLRDRLLPEYERLGLQLDTLATQLGRYASTEAMPAASRAPTGAIARQLRELRDALATDADALRRLETAAVFRVASALEMGEACLVIGPPDRGLTAIDRSALFPPVAALGSAGVGIGGEIARRAEDLVSIALTTLTSPARPIVVFVHAEIEPFVLSSPAFEQLIEHARLRGMDVLEWPVVTQKDPPGIETLNSDGLRPLVYFVISPNSAAASPNQDPELSGARRASRLAAVVSSLVEQGHSVLLSVNPSVFPTYGDADPIAGTFLSFGLHAQTGSPLVSQTQTQRGPVASTTLVARGTQGEHPLQQALRDLPTQLLWPIAIDIEPTAGVDVMPLLGFKADEHTWMESQWIGLWQVQTGPQAPTPSVRFDEGRDVHRDAYTLAAAAERSLPGSSRSQRVVMVGSNGWALDRIAQPRAAIDGRLVAVHPGNLEFFDASVSWLAGNDDEIARGVASSSGAMIEAIDERTLSRLRWFVIAGLPAIVLAVGLAFRIVKG